MFFFTIFIINISIIIIAVIIAAVVLMAVLMIKVITIIYFLASATTTLIINIDITNSLAISITLLIPYKDDIIVAL